MASISVQEFIIRVDNFIEFLPEFMLNTMEECLLIAKKDINTRIVNTGVNAEGEKFEEYTEKYLQFKKDVERYRGIVDFTLGNYSIEKALKARTLRKLDRVANAKYFGKNKITRFKRKLRSRAIKSEAKEIKTRVRARAIPQGSKLWESIQLQSKTAAGNTYRVVVAPLDDINKKKASGLSVKRGDILKLSDSEQTKLLARFEKQYAEFVSKMLQISIITP